MDWRRHVEPLEAIATVKASAVAAATSRRRLDEAVVAARNHGASWAGIGRATGMSRQSAHQWWEGMGVDRLAERRTRHATAEAEEAAALATEDAEAGAVDGRHANAERSAAR